MADLTTSEAGKTSLQNTSGLDHACSLRFIKIHLVIANNLSCFALGIGDYYFVYF